MTGTFTAGAVLTAANLNTAINSLTLNAQSGAGYTLVLADAGKLVTVSNASAQNLTIPLNSSVAYATGTVIEVLNIGAGTWTLTPTGGVTLTGSTSIPTSARVRLTKTGTDTWYANTLGGGGLVYVGGGTASAGASVIINNCFSATYDSYKVVIYATGLSVASVNWRLRVGGVDATAANYVEANTRMSSATVAGSTSTIAYGPLTDRTVTGLEFAEITLIRPAIAASTLALTLSRTDEPAMRFGSVIHTVATAYDGITVYPSTSTFTATVRVYGIANS